MEKSSNLAAQKSKYWTGCRKNQFPHTNEILKRQFLVVFFLAGVEKLKPSEQQPGSEAPIPDYKNNHSWCFWWSCTAATKQNTIILVNLSEILRKCECKYVQKHEENVPVQHKLPLRTWDTHLSNSGRNNQNRNTTTKIHNHTLRSCDLCWKTTPVIIVYSIHV